MDDRDDAGIVGYECWLFCDVSIVILARVIDVRCSRLAKGEK